MVAMVVVERRRVAAIFVAVLAACGNAHLVDVSQLSPNGVCPTGGVLIQKGTDDNDDGVLQPEEVDSSDAICSGAAASNALVDTTPEPSGPNCARGGTRVRTGPDLNGDGVLDDDEVQRVVYVCNSAPGSPTLVSVQSEQPGPNCELGGVVVRFGTDLDHDGMLDPLEVTSTSYVCTGHVPVNELVMGDFYLRNSFDQALIVGVRQIIGNLYVMPDASLPDPVTPNLEQVGRVQISRAFHSLSLPRLAHVSSLDVAQDAAFVVLDAPALIDSDAPGISITPASLTTVTLPSLTSVSGAFTIDASELTTLDLSSLTQVTGNLSITRSALPTIAAPQLSSVTGALAITNDPALTGVSFPSLASIGGGFTLNQYPLLSSLDLRSLTSVRRIELRNTPMLSESQVRIGAIQQLPEGLALDGLPWADLQPFTMLANASTVEIVRMAQATSVDLPQLDTTLAITISSCSSLATLTGFGKLTTLSSLDISANQNLTTLSGFSTLSTVSLRLSLVANGFVTLAGFPALQNVGALYVENHPALTTVDAFPSLVTAGTLQFSDNHAMTTLGGFQSLQTLTSSTIVGLHIVRQENLVSLGMPQLHSGSLWVDNSPLTSSTFPQLTDGQVALWGSKLGDVSGFPALRNGSVALDGATELISYSLPALQTGGVVIQGAPKLTTVQVPAFVSGELSLQAVPMLSAVEAPLAQHITRLWIYEADGLKQLRFPALQRTEAFQMHWVAQLESLDMPLLTHIDNNSGQGIQVEAFRVPACRDR